jgi:alkanesulfonate monooxygenase SsuD/methylene tetrahydromethanopterin reductase-like flavin-dependent oxidoreductase (luciferase family)
MIYASINAASVGHYARQGIPFMVDSSLTFDQLDALATVWADAADARDGVSEAAGPVALRSVWVAPSNAQAKAYVESRPQVKTVDYQFSLGPINKDGSVAKGYEYWRKGWHGRELGDYNSGSAWDDRWIAGDAERVTEQIRRLEAAGYKDICVILGHSLDADEERRSMELFAREVMPHFR